MLRKFLVLVFAVVCVTASQVQVQHELAASTTKGPKPTFKPMKGYVTFASIWCDSFLCPDWELDITRFDTEFRPTGMSEKLIKLLPKTPVTEMGFTVLTAFDHVSRTFYVSGAQNPGEMTLWVTTIDANVSVATLVSKSTFEYPVFKSQVVRMHFISGNTNGDLVLLMDSGDVLVLNSKTLTSTNVGNVLKAAGIGAGGFVAKASAVDVTGGVLYTIVETVNGTSASLVSMEVSTGAMTSVVLHLQDHHSKEDWSGEYFFQMVWIPEQASMIVLAQGGGPSGIDGFDQIIRIFPNGTASCLWCNIQDAGLYEFNTVPSLKNDDTYQTAAWDPVSQHFYFQCSVYDSDDDEATPTISMLYIDFSHKDIYIDTAISPFAFEYIGWFFIPVITSV